MLKNTNIYSFAYFIRWNVYDGCDRIYDGTREILRFFYNRELYKVLDLHSIFVFVLPFFHISFLKLLQLNIHLPIHQRPFIPSFSRGGVIRCNGLESLSTTVCKRQKYTEQIGLFGYTAVNRLFAVTEGD